MLVLWGALLLLVLPLLILRARRRGEAVGFKNLGFTALLLLYIAGVLAYTFMPLPARSELVCGSGVNYPRFFLGWSIRFALGENEGLLDALFSLYVLQMLLNVLLFVPFGLLARARWNLGFTPLLYAAFATSLAIELTQLTGFWGFYDCPVRTFDAEDIFNNTLGAVLGWALVVGWQYRAELGGVLRRLKTRP